MAGSYPDVPGRRMAYDRDGTVGAWLNGTTSVNSDISASDMQQMNDEDFQNIGGGDLGVALIFPELRDIVGTYFTFGDSSSGSAAGPGAFQWSPNSTNGVDGTWTTAIASLGTLWSGSPVAARNSITALALTGVKAVRATDGGGGKPWHPQVWHLYGSIAAGQNPDRLRLWHPTLDQEITGAYFDWADVPRSSTADRSFRVKNNSATLTANGITLSFSSRTDTTPNVAAQHLVEKSSAPGFAASQVLSSLTPGAISEVCTVRRVTPSNAVLSLWTPQLLAVASSWT